MKTKVFYFSATGNSLKAARDLALALGDTELVAIPHALKTKIDLSPDRIGLVFPVYAWGLPLMVVDFIKKIPPNIKNKYFFAVTTCGGSIGNTLIQLKNLFAEKGIELNAGFKIQMPGNYVPLYDICPQEKQDRIFGNEKKKINDVSKMIKDEKKHIDTGSPFTNWFLSGIIYPLFASHVKKSDKDFWVTDLCNACGVCRKVCPAGNIEIKLNKPVWLHKCEQCLACLHWCPEKAVQFGKATLKRKRYHHPEIKLSDMAIN